MYNNRKSNIELLRLILMFMIVCVHFTGNGVLNASNPIDVSSANWKLANIIDGLFYCCVNSFILITGYFGLRPSFLKWIKLELPVIFYCLTITLIVSGWSFRNIIGPAIPVLSNKYWFLTQYFLLYIISPFLNSYIEANDKQSLKKSILFGLALLVVVPTFTHFRLAEQRGMDFVNFGLLYLIGRYIKNNNYRINEKKVIITFVISTALIIALTVLAGVYLNVNKGWQSMFFAYNNLLVYIQSISLFLIFLNIDISSKIINYISPSAFYVYIIHETPALKEKIYTWLGCPDYYYSEYFFIHFIISVFFVFCACILTDIIVRRVLLKRFFDILVNIIEDQFKKIKLL